MQRERRLCLGIGLAAAIVAGALAVPAVAVKHGPGAFDRSFANHGTLVVRDVRDRGNSVAIGRKGRIVIAGLSSVMRLLPDGRLDRSFAGDGIWNVSADQFRSSFVSEGPSSLSVQRKGGVVVAGSFAGDFAVRRLTKRGQVDRSFGNNGMTRINFQMPINDALSLARTGQGKFIVGGVTCAASCDVALTRLDRDGSVDRSFGRNGKVVTSVADCFDGLQSMALDSHKRIVVGGTCSNHTVNLIRFKPDGGIDRSFGTHGRVHTRQVNIADITAPALAIDSHDRIDVGGGAKSKTHVLRYNPNGKLDRSFGNHGISTARYPGLRSSAIPSSAAIDHRGRIVLAGGYGPFGFTRLKPGGRLDRSFGRKGRVTIHNVRFHAARSVALDRQGRIVGVGYQHHDRRDHPVAVRLLP
jgi:uncharacterized delta-60 repeat protein